MRLDPNEISIVVAAYAGEVSFVSVGGVEIPRSDYRVDGPTITLRDGREFSLGDLPTGE